MEVKTHKYTNANTHTTHINTHTHTHINTHTHTHKYTHAHTDTHTHTYTHINTHMHMHTHKYTHAHMHTLTHINIHTHTHTHTQTHAHTNTRILTLLIDIILLYKTVAVLVQRDELKACLSKASSISSNFITIVPPPATANSRGWSYRTVGVPSELLGADIEDHPPAAARLLIRASFSTQSSDVMN